MNASTPQEMLMSTIGAALPHDSAALHVSGEATYIDDIVEPRGTLYAAMGCSTKAHADVRSMDSKLRCARRPASSRC